MINPRTELMTKSPTRVRMNGINIVTIYTALAFGGTLITLLQ